MDLTMVEVLRGPGILLDEEQPKERGVKVHSAGVHIEHKMTAVQRKAWFFMLYNAVQASDEQDIYEVRIKDLADAIGCQATNLKRIKESLEGMVGITVKWDIFGKVREHDTTDQKIWGVSALLADCEVFPNSGICEYSFSAKLKRRFLKPSMFVKLNLLVTRRFKSKNSIALYCMALDYLIIAKNHGKKLLSVEEMRQLLGIPENKYQRVVDLHKHVLKKAVEDINEKSDMQMTLTPQKKGRKIVGFYVEMSIKPENLDFYRKNKLAFEKSELPTQIHDFSSSPEVLNTPKSPLNAFLSQYRINRASRQVQEVEQRVAKLLTEEHVEPFLLFVMEYVQAEEAQRLKMGKEPIRSISGFYVNQLQQEALLQSFLLEQNQKEEKDRLASEAKKNAQEKLEREFDRNLKRYYEQDCSVIAKSYLERHFEAVKPEVTRVFESLNPVIKKMITARYGLVVTAEYLQHPSFMATLLTEHREAVPQLPAFEEWKKDFLVNHYEAAQEARHKAEIAVQS